MSVPNFSSLAGLEVAEKFVVVGWVVGGGVGNTWPGVHKTGIRGIQDTRQIVDGKTNDIENNNKKGGSKPLS